MAKALINLVEINDINQINKRLSLIVPDDQTQPFEMTPWFEPFTIRLMTQSR